jgi:hypothetical protein
MSVVFCSCCLPLDAHVSGLLQNKQRMPQPCVNTRKRTPGPAAYMHVGQTAQQSTHSS